MTVDAGIERFGFMAADYLTGPPCDRFQRPSCAIIYGARLPGGRLHQANRKSDIQQLSGVAVQRAPSAPAAGARQASQGCPGAPAVRREIDREVTKTHQSRCSANSRSDIS